MTSKAPAVKLLDTICFHSTLVPCSRPCCACDCMTGQGQFVLPRPSINSVQKAFPAGGTQPGGHWPLLFSALYHIYRVAMTRTYTGKDTSGPLLISGCWCFGDRSRKTQTSTSKQIRFGSSECHCHAFFPLLSFFSSLSNSFMLAASATFPSSSSSCSFLHVPENAYKDIPAHASIHPSSTLASSGCSSALSSHILFTRKSV